MRSFFFIFSTLVFLLSVNNSIALSKEKPHTFDTLNLVWTANYGEEGEQVYTSSFAKKKWSIPVQISKTSEYVFHSTGTVAEDGSLWVVWTESEKKKKHLYFSTNKEGQWSKPSQIVTGMDDNRNVTIVTDSDGQPFLAWTGVDKKYSDIFWSRIVQGAWSIPLKAHDQNNVPDVDPALWFTADGDIALSWQTFTEGSPVTAFLQWDGKSWVKKKQRFRESHSKIQRLRSESLPLIPKFIQEQHKTEFFFKDKYGTGTIP